MKRIIIALLMLAPVAAVAQMSLHDCLVYARDHFHRNVTDRLEVSRAAADRDIAAAALMPSLTLTSAGNVSYGRNIDPETNTYDNKQTYYAGFGLQLSLPVFDGLVSVNNYKAARIARLRRISQAQVDEDMTSLDVIRAFYNVSYCKALVGQMQQELTRDSVLLASTMRQQDLGSKSGADVAEVEAIVSADRYRLTHAAGDLRRAWLALRSAMGMPLADCPELDLIEEDDPGAVEPTRLSLPQVTAARQAVDESRARLRAARGAFSPRISLNAGVSTSYYKMAGADAPRFSRQWSDNMGEYVGFTVSIPLFTGLESARRLKRASIDYEVSLVACDRTVYEVEQATAEAVIDYESATAELAAARARVEAEERAYCAVSRRFELGGASAIDLNTAGARLATARAEAEGKRIQQIVSRITLGYYRGELLIND